jgi:hypothetical protein
MKWEYHFYQAGSGRDFEQAEETMNNLGLSWSRLSEQLFRVDKWSVCRG